MIFLHPSSQSAILEEDRREERAVKTGSVLQSYLQAVNGILSVLKEDTAKNDASSNKTGRRLEAKAQCQQILKARRNVSCP